MIRKRIVFHGRVQGVGFRYRMCRAASVFGCTGWVRNEYDGTVVMEIQGTEEQISRAILSADGGLFVEVEETEENVIPNVSGEYGFKAC